MIRVSEVVLPGHPDKLCDQIADEIIAECVKVDADAYRQVEVAVWSDQVWLSGGVCTRRPVEVRFDEVGRRVGRRIGLTAGSWIDADRYEVKDTVCREIGDPRRWTSSVNDQAIVIGWAGYDARIRYISPEHFLAHACREALFASFQGGLLDRHGPDGKLLLRLREDSEGWTLEHLLVTIQHPREASILEVCRGVARVAEEAYARVRATHPRWLAPWDEVETIINPNGPLLNGGSDGDNGQTGRKLVADYFGPRVPIGGGALSGKHLTHVDRTGAYAARETAVRAVQGGAGECLVRVSYAPGLSAPLDVSYELTGLGPRQPAAWFGHEAMQTRYPTALDYAALARGGGTLLRPGAALEHGEPSVSRPGGLTREAPWSRATSPSLQREPRSGVAGPSWTRPFSAEAMSVRLSWHLPVSCRPRQVGRSRSQGIHWGAWPRLAFGNGAQQRMRPGIDVWRGHRQRQCTRFNQVGGVLGET